MKLPKIYEPQQYEPKIYQLWETAKAFKPTSKKGSGEHFSIVLPPPNANGNLHTGHALTVALQDIAIRYHRLKGDSTVYIPGADHAGFETWVVFEKQLAKEGKSRFDFSREQLYSMVWDFVQMHRGNMDVQLRNLGASLDWDSLTYTLDKKVVDTTYATFKKLWDDDLVYRGKRLVNYCTQHHTGFADIEVDYEDKKVPLYYIKYGPFTLATTRPETKFGDTGVAVHPEDERYKQYIGKDITVEGVNGPFTVKVIADELVDPNFGTGVVKVTPAHSFDDFEMGERHNLPSIQVIDLDGKMTNKAGKFAGLTVLEARKAVVEAMQQMGMIEKIDHNYKTRVGLCYKCKTIIEPMLLDQWFVNVKPLAKLAITAIEAGEIKFYPASKSKVLVNYLKSLKDWNISRQIPWGIPIPAFQSQQDPNHWIFDQRTNLEEIEVDGIKFKRDPDTFDTWFSSGQWPYITTNYLDKNNPLSQFYPLSVMETGSDILFPWVARMIMLGLYRTKKVPFTKVYLHGLVLDEHGQKMSKSKGNVLNPQELLDNYGSDATRMGLIANRSAGVNQSYQPATVITARNFANKLWNIARFIEDKVGDSHKNQAAPTAKSIAEHWILQQLNLASNKIADLLQNYRFAEAYETLYHVIWDDVADWYIEASKTNTGVNMLPCVLKNILIMAHPFAPFVTETIWQTLKWQDGLVMLQKWPENFDFDAAKAAEFDQLKDLITEIRFINAELGGKQTLLYKQDLLIEQNTELIAHLAKLNKVTKAQDAAGLKLASAKHEVWLDLNAKTIAEHQQKLINRLNDCKANIERLSARLNNESYVANAPQNIVLETKKQLDEQNKIAARLTLELQIN